MAVKPQNNQIGFVHIGKTAGTQIKILIDYINKRGPSKKLIGLKHYCKLDGLMYPHYFFSIRQPIARFKSAFYARKREDQPTYKNPHTKNEAMAFKEFNHANELAEALFSEDRGYKALCAMQAVGHLARQQVDWIVREGYFLEKSPPIWIIRQENFNADFETFLNRADIGVNISDIDLTPNSVKAHISTYSGIEEIDFSKKAKDNLKNWYARDFEFYKHCDAWLNNGGKL